MTTNPYAAADKIRTITGTVTLVDGSTHEFSIDAIDGHASWGAAASILGSTSNELDSILEFMQGEDLIATLAEIEDYENRDVEPDPDRDSEDI